MDGKVILNGERMALTIKRLCYQIRENHPDLSNTCIIGIQRTGVLLAERLKLGLEELIGIDNIPLGKLDVTFHRDDFRTRSKPLEASPTEMNFIVEQKNVILVDDVLYTGRTIQAAMAALQHFGRPAKIELLTLIDRHFNRDLPIQADYIGLTIDTIADAYVKVNWGITPIDDQVILLPGK